MVKKLIAFLLLGIFLTGGAYGKVLIITANTSSPHAHTIPIVRNCMVAFNAVGIRCDQAMAGADSTWIEAHWGDYSCAIFLNLPECGSSFSNASQILAAGWGNLHLWVKRGGAKEAGCPTIFPVPWRMRDNAVWSCARTGQISITYRSGSSWNYQVMKSASGDSMYIYTQRASKYESLVADSLSWVDALYYRDGPSDGQKYGTMWRTYIDADHQTVYISLPAHCQMYSEIVATAIAMFEPDAREIKLPVLVDFFGRASGTQGDTVSLDYNLNHDILPYIADNDMKVEFITMAQWLNDEGTNAFTSAMATILGDPDHYRAILSGRTATSHDVLGHYDDLTQAQMESAIDSLIDSMQVWTETAGIDTTRLVAVGSSYGATTSSGDHARAMNALGNSPITDVYCLGNAYYGLGYPAETSRVLNSPRRCFVGDNKEELRVWEFSREMKYLFASHNDSIRVPRTSIARAAYSGQHIGICMGTQYADPAAWPHSISGATWAVQSMRHSRYHPGRSYFPTMLTGGSITGGYPAGTDSTYSQFKYALQDLKLHINAANYIVANYGTSGRSKIFDYGWMTDIVWDRRFNRQWFNSHVTRE